MKKLLLFLVAVAPLFVAATARHVVLAPLRFGMTSIEASTAYGHFRASGKSNNTLAGIRAHFITSGTKKPGRLTDADGSIPVVAYFGGAPAVDAVMIRPVNTGAESYETEKKIWQSFQDVGDSKFNRVGKAVGEFPTVEALAANGVEVPTPSAAAGSFRKEVVTDTWEADGVRVELVASGYYKNPEAEPFISPLFRAKEITPAK